jgi:O-antigen ligase
MFTAHMRRACITFNAYLLPGLIAFAPIHSKVLGAAWITFCVYGIYLSFNTHRFQQHIDLISSSMTFFWLKICATALTLAAISALIWHGDVGTLNAPLRMLLAAVAAYGLAHHHSLSPRTCRNISDAIALACVVALIWVAWLFMHDAQRVSLASNAIAWAVVISFYVCLLLPLALSAQESVGRRRIWLCCAGCGIVAILLSQSRGAFLIIPWSCLLVAWFWHKKNTTADGSRRTLRRLLLIVSIVLAASWLAPGDLLRIRQAAHDIQQVRSTENFNSSVGARLYLWQMAIDGIQQSPWIGIGSVERLRRIKQAGTGGTDDQIAKLEAVRSLGHVHNEYLHAALDGGLLGLASFLSTLLGMAILIRRLARSAPFAAWQLGGVLCMHMSASLTNVNFAHNYYATALALAVLLPLFVAQRHMTKDGAPSCTY